MNRRRLPIFVILFALLSIAAPYTIHRELGAQPFSLDGRLFSWPVLGGALILLIVYYAADGLRLYYILKALGQNVSKTHLWKLVFINLLFSNITPMATGGGVAQVWYLRQYGVPLGTSTAATTICALLAIVFIFLPTPVLVMVLPIFNAADIFEHSGLLLSLIAVAYLCFFVVILMKVRWIVPLFDALLHLARRYELLNRARLRRWRRKAMRELILFTQGINAFLKGSGSDVALSILYTAVFLLALFSFPFLLFWGLGYDFDYWAVVGMIVVVTFIMYFSPTPGGAGLSEGGFALCFASWVAPAELVLVTVAWRFLTIYLGMLIGAFVSLGEMVKTEPPHA